VHSCRQAWGAVQVPLARERIWKGKAAARRDIVRRTLVCCAKRAVKEIKVIALAEYILNTMVDYLKDESLKRNYL